MNRDQSDARILALFEGAGPVETPTPGVRAWLARDTSSGQKPVLIKRVDAAGKGRATGALALLHPGIVRTRRWFAEGAALYVVRDVVRGKNLRQRMTGEGTARSADTVRRLLLPVIDALWYAHGEGFAHGGVSPENVLIGDDGAVGISDWATADPKAPQHFLNYNGTASVAGDVAALGKVLVEFLPTGGAFASAAVRDRIGGILRRCDTLADLRETVNALERLAAAPLPRAPQTVDAARLTDAVRSEPPAAPAALDFADDADTTQGWRARTGTDMPRLTCALAEKSARVMQGSGGAAALIVRNEGSGTLVVRMIATQHPWLNVRPIELPLTLTPGEEKRIPFAISAARLTPGEYRSEVYLSANAAGKTAEDLRGGWFKHTVEMRITVEGGPTLPIREAKPSYPADAPRIPAGPGCLLLLPVLVAGLLRGDG